MYNNFKLTVIYDNEKSSKSNLCHGFGFSCYIEFQGQKILFDTGGDVAKFDNNIKELNINLKAIDKVFLSHHHWDHTDGISKVLHSISPNATIFIPTNFNRKILKPIPLNMQVITNKDLKRLDDNLYSLTMNGRSGVISELFRVTEQALIFDTPLGLIVITGCGHPGVVNILKETKKYINSNIYALVGGFHLHHKFDKTVKNIVTELNEFGIKIIAPCHCTGEKAKHYLQQASFKSQYKQMHTGSVLEFTL
jgi:7,8-dihydropterin-6-yl-methyl-4-(beta-D-ribofuranosyl)aminobenzene 5'-phosphate synthase